MKRRARSGRRKHRPTVRAAGGVVALCTRRVRSWRAALEACAGAGCSWISLARAPRRGPCSPWRRRTRWDLRLALVAAEPSPDPGDLVARRVLAPPPQVLRMPRRPGRYYLFGYAVRHRAPPIFAAIFRVRSVRGMARIAQ